MAVIVERMSLLNSGEGNPMYGQKHSKDTREHMSDIYSDARRERIGNLNRGKEITPERREFLRQVALARPPMSEETRAKVSANHASVIQMEITSIKDTTIPPYTARGILEAADYIGCGEKTVRRALKQKEMIVKKD
jgi:hypothetical protein